MSSSAGTGLQQTTAAMAADPTIARAEVTATGELGDRCRVDVRVGDETVVFDMPAALGGTGLAPSPGQHALAALAACQAITYRIWSEKLGVRLDALRVDVRGQVDLQGLLGIDAGTCSGFAHVDLAVEIDGPEPAQRYEQLRGAVNEHCPVLDVFAAPVPVTASLIVAGTSLA